MNNREPKSPFVTILQGLVVGLILIFNAAMTAVFGWDNLAAAFGGETLMPRFAGALYALLIFDMAAVAYLLVYRRNSFTQWQRHVALVMAVICLVGSISATVAQLANTAFGLDAWSEYKATVESFSLVFMISLTAVHAVVAATFSLMGNEGRMTDKAIATIAKVSDTAFTAAVKQIEEEDNETLVETIKADIRTAILNQLGFTKDLKQIGAAPGLRFDGKEASPAPAHDDDEHWTIAFLNNKGEPWWFNVVGDQNAAIREAKRTGREGSSDVVVKNGSGDIVWPEHKDGSVGNWYVFRSDRLQQGPMSETEARELAEGLNEDRDSTSYHARLGLGRLYDRERHLFEEGPQPARPTSANPNGREYHRG